MCTAQSREALCVYCTVYRGTVCVLHSLQRHCLCKDQSGVCIVCDPKHVGVVLNIFKYFIIIPTVSTNYIFLLLLDNKVF